MPRNSKRPRVDLPKIHDSGHDTRHKKSKRSVASSNGKGKSLPAVRVNEDPVLATSKTVTDDHSDSINVDMGLGTDGTCVGVYLRRFLMSMPIASSMLKNQRTCLRRFRVISRTLSNTKTSTAIRVEPSDALIDVPVAIEVSGLLQHQKITLYAILANDGKQFLSCAHYTADVKGQVKCAVQPSEGGSYTGIEPMGLFWSMLPSSKHRKATRLLKKDVTTPYNVSIAVLSNHRDLSTIQSQSDTSDVLASTQVKRWYMGRGVQRIPVREGRIRGALFIPQGDPPFPAVLDMFGGSGGLFDFRAALLASRGYLTLSLAYLYYEGLPSHHDELDIHYFLDAAEWLSQHPRATPDGIGVIGVSYGAAMSYLLAAHCPKVRAAIAINGLPFSPLTDQYLNGEFIEGYVPYLAEKSEDGYGKNAFAFKDGNIQVTPIWRQHVKILSLLGEEDKSVDPNYYRCLMSEVPPDKRENIESIFYPGAGHLIEPPYTPHCPESYLADKWETILKWGGEPKAHADAQEDAWRRTLEHFNKYLKGEDS